MVRCIMQLAKKRSSLILGFICTAIRYVLDLETILNIFLLEFIYLLIYNNSWFVLSFLPPLKKKWIFNTLFLVFNIFWRNLHQKARIFVKRKQYINFSFIPFFCLATSQTTNYKTDFHSLFTLKNEFGMISRHFSKYFLTRWFGQDWRPNFR